MKLFTTRTGLRVNNLLAGAVLACAAGSFISAPAHADGVNISIQGFPTSETNGEVPPGHSYVYDLKATVANPPGETSTPTISWSQRYFHYTDTSGNLYWVADGNVGSYDTLYIDPDDSSRARLRLPLLSRAHAGYTYATTVVASASTPTPATGQIEINSQS